MTEQEIVYDYKTARYPEQQIKILAELNCAEPEDIVELLRRNGVQANYKQQEAPGRPQRVVPSTIIEELYEDGLTDAAIARELGCSDFLVWRWREIRCLPSNAHNLRKIESARQMYRQGKTYADIARSLGVTAGTVSGWHHRHWPEETRLDEKADAKTDDPPQARNRGQEDPSVEGDHE